MFARAVIVAALMAGAWGCGVSFKGLTAPAYVSDDGNYIRFEHAFTDAAAAEVRDRAIRICGDRKQVAIKTTNVCSLTKCTTNYQCISSPDAAKYGL
jgi:hypothetical protein